MMTEFSLLGELSFKVHTNSNVRDFFIIIPFKCFRATKVLI